MKSRGRQAMEVWATRLLPPGLFAIQSRKRYRKSLPKVPLELDHTKDCRLLPDRRALLGQLPQGGIVAEVGVAFGDFSAEILEINKPRTLYLIDLWENRRYNRGLDAVQERFADRIGTGQVQLRRGRSVDELERFDDAFFDWVYLDTSHLYATISAELRVAEAKIKPGGYIAGHDFSVGNVVKPSPYGVIQACTEFCVRRGWGFAFLTLESHGAFSFALKRL